MNVELWSVLFLAFGLGMLHALDADHIVAISGLSCQKPDKKTSLLFCARWAVGHGSALLLIGAAVMFLGMAIPQHLSELAEHLVGFVLILIGLAVLRDIYRQRAHLHFHHHDGSTPHAHWHRHPQAAQQQQSELNRSDRHKADKHQHSHAPVFVGVLHGVAGSAPLLALLPLTQMKSPWLGMSYLLLFGLGVFMAMLIFGGVIGQLFGWLKSWGNRFINLLRLSVSIISIIYGVKLVMDIF
jgi:nickel/cobalt exporter